MDRKQLEHGIDADTGRVVELLNSLPRVEAPANFDFGVKAKIAAATDAGSRASLIPLVKIVAPVALVLVAVGSVIFYGTLPGSTDDLTVEAPAPAEREMPASSTEIPSPVMAAQRSGPRADETIVASHEESAAPSRSSESVRRPNIANRSRRGTVDQPFSSVDSTLGSANVILPPGLESANPGRRNSNVNVGSATEISIRDVLGILGIDADFVDGGWKVKAATASSTAERSGVRANDVLEAIDGRRLTETTTFNGSLTPKVLRVRRDGKTINLNLQH